MVRTCQYHHVPCFPFCISWNQTTPARRARQDQPQGGPEEALQVHGLWLLTLIALLPPLSSLLPKQALKHHTAMLSLPEIPSFFWLFLYYSSFQDQSDHSSPCLLGGPTSVPSHHSLRFITSLRVALHFHPLLSCLFHAPPSLAISQEHDFVLISLISSVPLPLTSTCG